MLKVKSLLLSTVNHGATLLPTRPTLHFSRPTPRLRPTPLNTIELQKRASRFFRMGSDETMKVPTRFFLESYFSRLPSRSISVVFYPIPAQRPIASRRVSDSISYLNVLLHTASPSLGFELIPLLEDHRLHHLWGNYVTNLLQDGKFTWPRFSHPNFRDQLC